MPAYDKYGRGNQFSWPLFLQGWHSSVYPQAPAGLIFSGDTAQNPYGKAFTASHWALFSPRLGLVWDPKGDGRQTIRASFNLMHDTTELFYPERWTTNAPYVSSITLTSGQFSNPFASYTLNGVTGDPFPGNVVFPTQGTYISVPGNAKPQYMMQWNISYQRQVGANWLLQANYLGNATRHIWGSTDVNYAVGSIAGASTSNTNNRRLTYLANPTTGQYLREHPADRRRRQRRIPRPVPLHPEAPFAQLYDAEQLQLEPLREFLGLRRRTGGRDLPEPAERAAPASAATAASTTG